MGARIFAKSDVLNDPFVRAQYEYFSENGQDPLGLEEFYGYVNRETGENVPFSYYMNSIDLSAGGAAIFSTRLTSSERQCKDGCGIDGECSYGITHLQAGLMIPVLGIGTKYSGLYELSKVRHRYDSNGYHTSFEGKCITRARGKAECDPCDPCCGPSYSNNTRSQRTGQKWRTSKLSVDQEVDG